MVADLHHYMNEEVEKLVTAGKLNQALGKNLSKLEAGVVCLHKSWGVGRVASWDLLGDRIKINFKDKPGHDMKLEFAAKSLEALDDTHILAQWISDPDALSAAAIDDPVTFAKSVLNSYGGSMTLDAWDGVVKGKIIPEAKFRSWWDGAKREMRKERSFVVPSKRNLPLELRAEDVSPSKAMLSEFREVRDAKSKLKGLDAILKALDAFDDKSQLFALVGETNEAIEMNLRIAPAASLELLLARDEFIEKVDGAELGEGMKLQDLIRTEEVRLPDILRGMAASRQRQVYREFPEAFGDEWIAKIFELLQQAGPRGVMEVTRFMVDNEKGKVLMDYLRIGLQQRTLSSDLISWICKERKRTAVEVFGPEICPAIINSLERDHYADRIAKSTRLHDLLSSDKELIPDLLSDADVNQIRNFARRIKSSPVFEELNRGSLLAKVIKLYPDVQDLVSGKKSGKDIAPQKMEGLVVSWESLKQRQGILENLIHKEIPDNSKEIQIAREYGDLKENAEYKAAKEMQAVLMRRQAEMEGDISGARGTDFADADISAVGIGTKVDFADLGTGDTESYTILGAWDTDTEKGIISYLSAAGMAMLGKSVGDKIGLPAEDGGTRDVKITEISAYNITASA
jgi:transcription elongation GreA/GreB family factor